MVLILEILFACMIAKTVGYFIPSCLLTNFSHPKYYSLIKFLSKSEYSNKVTKLILLKASSLTLISE